MTKLCGVMPVIRRSARVNCTADIRSTEQLRTAAASIESELGTPAGIVVADAGMMNAVDPTAVESVRIPTEGALGQGPPMK